MVASRSRPSTSCIVGGWLVGEKHPARTVVAEVLALAEDGYVEVVADDNGYTVRRGPADPAVLWEDRAEVLAGLFHDGDPVQLRRPVLPPLVPPQGPISTDRLRTAVSRTSDRYGFISPLRWFVLTGMLLGIASAVAAGVAGLWTAAAALGIGSGLLGTAWLQSPYALAAPPASNVTGSTNSSGGCAMAPVGPTRSCFPGRSCCSPMTSCVLGGGGPARPRTCPAG